MKWLIPISLVAAVGGTAHADQCAWLDDGDIAQRARALLARSPKVIAFCEPCGDTAPGVPEVARSVAITHPADGYDEIEINGSAVDLAYMFVQTSPSRYENLALLSGCPATGVSPTLDVAAETTSGVLITADTKPVPAPVAVAAPPAPAPVAPAPIAAPPAVYIYASAPQAVPWLAIALAAAGGALAGGMLTLLLAVARRRQAMRPRASELR
jgi:hypothetical protein